MIIFLASVTTSGGARLKSDPLSAVEILSRNVKFIEINNIAIYNLLFPIDPEDDRRISKQLVEED